MTDTTVDLFVTSLEVAVPMWLMEANMRHGDTRAELLAAWRADASRIVPEKGDILQFRSKTAGSSAKVFNAFARGMAALSCHQGGVKVFGRVWCAEHSPSGRMTDEYVCARCVAQYPDAPKGCTCCTAAAPVNLGSLPFFDSGKERRAKKAAAHRSVEEGPSV